MNASETGLKANSSDSQKVEQRLRQANGRTSILADRAACLLAELMDMAFEARVEGKDDGGILYLVGLAVGDGEDFDARRNRVRSSDNFDRAKAALRRLVAQ